MKQKLIESAILSRKKAYAPYSNYTVGAGLLTADNEIICGCNVENASLSLSICAERCAVFTAVATGLTTNTSNIQAIAVATKDGSMPCGSCLQVLVEFASENLLIIAVNEEGLITETRLADLLPKPFQRYI